MSNKRTRLLAVEVAVPILIVIAWWVVSSGSTNPFFPPLSGIIKRFQELWLFDRFASDIVPSVMNLVIGYTLGAVVGVAIGVLMAQVPPVRWALEPIVHFARSVPPVALVPILIALLGFGTGMRLTTLTLAAVFPTLIATIDGLRGIDPVLREIAAAYQLTKAERILRVYIPAAMPQVFSGLRVSLQIAFVILIASEMLGSSEGIGAQTILAQQSFAFLDMWAGMLLLGVLGYLANFGFDLVERRTMTWYFGARDQARSS